MQIDGTKLNEAMEAAEVKPKDLMKVTKYSKSRISMLRTHGGNVGELQGKAILKRLGVKSLATEAEEN